MVNKWVKDRNMKVLYVSQETKDQLACIAKKRDTFDDVISMLIDEHLKVKE